MKALFFLLALSVLPGAEASARPLPAVTQWPQKVAEPVNRTGFEQRRIAQPADSADQTKARRGRRPTARDAEADKPPSRTNARSESAGRGHFFKHMHTVEAGQTLGRIAARYKVRVKDLLIWNNLETAEYLRIGQKLTVYTTWRERILRRIPYVVEKGDRLATISKKFKMSTARLKRLNPRLKDARFLHVGMKLAVEVEGPESPSEAEGRPQQGALANGEKLPTGESYVIRRPERAWGTNDTITALVGVFHYMQNEFPGYVAVIGDISKEGGGHLPPHHSHQNGRDIDISYYVKGFKKLSRFKQVSAESLDTKRTWGLLRAILEHSDVEVIFVDYQLQKPLFEEAEHQGVSAAKLEKWFQYPRGRHVPQGLMRHSRGHANHFHLRFACPPSDANCS